ncbi:MAG: hypothetical protein HRF51_05005 [bacterium]|jgi:hypothetical protein
MGFSPLQLLDIGLNFAGFLTAGILTFYVYHWISTSRQGRAAGRNIVAAASTADVVSAAMPRRPERKMPEAQFVRLVDTDSLNSSDTPGGLRGEYRVRDRKEILEQAREMLAQKKRSATVQKILPVTEAEITLLKQSQKLQGKARMR